MEYGQVPQHEVDTSQRASGGAPWHAAVLCGIINGIITIPVMTSFAAIIFQVSLGRTWYHLSLTLPQNHHKTRAAAFAAVRIYLSAVQQESLGKYCNTSTFHALQAYTGMLLQDHFFQPVLSDMVKLVFLSSGVHQVIFSVKSTLPYAVGQVQDVGLIFLSAMATSVVEACKKAGQDREVTQGTVLVTLLVTTFLVGILIILTGTAILHSLCMVYSQTKPRNISLVCTCLPTCVVT